MQLSAPLEIVKGVGPRTAVQLHAAGLKTIGDLIYFLPYRHEDFSSIQPIGSISPGKVSLRGKFSDIKTKRVRRGLHLTEAVLRDKSGAVAVVWFNQPYRSSQLEKATEWLVSGDFKLSGNKYQLQNPSVEAVDSDAVKAGNIVPVYHQIKGLKSQVVLKLIHELRPVITMLPETLPPDIVRSEKLISHADAMVNIHFPASGEMYARARERLAFEELFALLLAAQLNKQENAKLSSWSIPFDKEVARGFVDSLPFTLTSDQKLAAWEIIQGFESGQPMNRLLQGDVGSGKTVVAGLAALLAARQGYQTALMAPTELLAEQHARTLSELLASHRIPVALLTGSVKGGARRSLLEAVADGQIGIVVGTHALFQEAVRFHRLGFVVIDEQHRFGVAQRQRLLEKSEKMPHLLAMTATPIPRSLQLTVYGELDVSLIKERPKGRMPIKTKIISPNSREPMEQLIDKEIQSGRQVYVVCPLIDESPESELKSVEAELKRLRRGLLKKRKIELLHGKLSSEEKQRTMQRFLDRDIDVLVSTTVVEVGVDAPNATVMVIEGAERFGLAQLHQLRGRVGRSNYQSYCFLVPTGSQAPSQRLREMERSQDGFYLAERDLEIRGPGEIYGRAQSGELNLTIASLQDTTLLKRVKAAAERSMKSGFELVQYERLAKEVARYQRLTTLN